jgi:hypothetical protein
MDAQISATDRASSKKIAAVHNFYTSFFLTALLMGR